MACSPKLLVEELRYIENPARVFEAFLNEPMAFLLESALFMERFGRYSILGSNPKVVLRSKGGITEVCDSGRKIIYKSDPLAAVGKALKLCGLLEGENYNWLPFTGGMVGYFGYDLNRQIEKLPDLAVDDQGIPDIYLGLYTEAIIIDHKDKKSYAIAYSNRSDRKALSKASLQLRGIIRKVEKRTKKGIKRAPLSLGLAKARPAAVNLTSNFSRNQYERAIERAKDYINAGDIFQVNLAQRFAADLKTDHYSLYRKLRKANPAPFSAFLNYGAFSVLSSSPERYMLVDGRHVETRPIKGTRPRYDDMGKDNMSVKELLESEKDAAEHVMIVDVKRNDLGRVCENGSVSVPELMVVESYKAVHHLVSTVAGRLRPEVGPMDIIRAGFPGGSITGAPKIRAMEIIEELEPHRRNIYTGAIGYISSNGKMDTNIAIRTITAIGNRAFLQAGGGIVSDSDARSEYEETLDKARALFHALGLKEDSL